jgi:hypothetical protein
MPSVGPVIEDIEPNEALKTLGIIRFWKHGSVLQIMIGEKTLLTFDIDKNKVQKTLSNFNDAAIEAGLSIDVLAELKIILPRDYLDFLLLDGGESKEGKVSSSKNNSNSSTAREQGEGVDKENKPASALIADFHSLNHLFLCLP